MTHLYAVRSFRGNGIGALAELLPAQKFAKSGLQVFKCVHSDNERVMHDEDTTVDTIVGQWLAQLKNLDSLKLCDLGFSRVLMTIGIFIFHVDAPLAQDGVTSKTVFRDFLTILPLVDFRTFIDPPLLPEGGERAWGRESARREGRGHARETRVDQEIGSQQVEGWLNLLTNWKSRKTVFDVTPSGANGAST
ncbi:hypothetical protein PRIPAC_95737 [Pristionchus pacificus]|uniref:Uncharacterized protein n=1 Tax=Pristionchus pacificus TaxID=54126 RepID=A0A8R1UB22_PRIPA|nr:hypothetical protein PRIPAC_95737 [Pristionchus pacificus]|eukprot:PDM84425.1 hypothetical protein PRIPAC_33448 [Pristionchus pacificus]